VFHHPNIKEAEKCTKTNQKYFNLGEGINISGSPRATHIRLVLRGTNDEPMPNQFSFKKTVEKLTLPFFKMLIAPGLNHFLKRVL
jgi:hypothetical protein